MPFGLGTEVRQTAIWQKGGSLRERAKVQSTKENIDPGGHPKETEKMKKGKGKVTPF